MPDKTLQQAAELYYGKISQKKYAKATLRNYRQRINALLRFCDSNDFESFGYKEAEIYSQWLNDRIERREIKDKHHESSVFF